MASESQQSRANVTRSGSPLSQRNSKPSAHQRWLFFTPQPYHRADDAAVMAEVCVVAAGHERASPDTFGVHYSDISALLFTAQHAPDPEIFVARQVSDGLLNSKFVLV
jgi:hypothetical protein